jgi:hypothetical protein
MKTAYALILSILTGYLLFFGCEFKNKAKLFTAMDSTIMFANTLTENDSLNYFSYPYMYMGGGVAIGDINNDGLADVFLTGNMVENKLYLNKGHWKFEDITQKANIQGDKRWYTGITMVDINTDGWLDIYLSVSGKDGDTKNQLYINNKNLTFTEAAMQYGIADSGASIQSVFFDYDKDGDLDLYVANYPKAPFGCSNLYYKRKMMRPLANETDHLFRNNGNGTFTDVSKQALVANYGLTLGLSIGDFNNDNWDDIYISNDFSTPDRLFINNKDGTFKDVIKQVTQQTAFYAMGSDVADFNNDGLLDIIQVDMTPEDNRRAKTNMASMNASYFWNTVKSGFHYQYMHNALQLNRGIPSYDTLPVFSNIAKMANLSLTDWSWAPVFADLDNDGWKDVFITNGTKRDVNNKDFFEKLRNEVTLGNRTGVDVKNIPSEPIENKAYKNNGDLSFQDIGDAWGLSHKGFSNGVAYADLDNDGDLDIVVNNLDEQASLYRNNTNTDKNHYIQFEFKGSPNNPNGLGAKVHLFYNNKQQYQQLTLTRGFQSSVAPMLHFGLGNQEVIEAVVIVWPDGKQEKLVNISPNQLLTIHHKNATSPEQNPLKHTNTVFEDITTTAQISFQHKENNYNDYFKEPLLPYQTSKLGPGIAVGDVNADGLEDFYIGNAAKSQGSLIIQNPDLEFQTQPWLLDEQCEDMDALFFDADGDEDLDLYVVSGGNEFRNNPETLQDRLYINTGHSKFKKALDALPKMPTSGSVVKAADFDKDGDLDLFVGGRLVPGNYPLPAKSYLLRNDSKKGGPVKFTDITKIAAPGFEALGLVTDALWSDFNKDGNLDLVITGEWMPVLFYENQNGSFISKTAALGLDEYTGWYSSLAQGDFDNDGDTDYIAGNLGTNYKYKASKKEPFEIYSADFDKNGKLDIVLSYYQDKNQFPLRGRECSAQQIPAIKYKFKDYNSFANASLTDVYGKQNLETALKYKVTTFSSNYIENRGNNPWFMKPLPNEAQLSSINEIIVSDVNNDSYLDIIIGGNLYTSEVETPRNDASIGMYLTGNGDGTFNPIPATESGLYLIGDVKDMAMLSLQNKSHKVIVVAKNNAAIQMIKLKSKIRNSQ